MKNYNHINQTNHSADNVLVPFAGPSLQLVPTKGLQQKKKYRMLRKGWTYQDQQQPSSVMERLKIISKIKV